MHLDITTRDYKTLKYLLNAFLPGTTVWAFGSRVKFTSKPESDLDLVAFTPEKIFLVELKDAFAESDLPFNVNILDWAVIPDNFKKNIEKEYVVVQDEKEQIPPTWETHKLGDLVEKITKGTTPTTLDGGFTKSGINFIKSEAISYDGRVDQSTFAFIDEVTNEKLKRSQLKKDDILFSMAGIFLGKNAMVTDEMLPANTNQALAIIRLNQAKVIPKFIHYYLRQADIIKQINSISGQSAQPNINFEEIKSIEVKLPDFKTQKEITSVFSSLDNKIDLNLKMNQTLEGIAQAIFKEWFVNFNFPGFDGELVDGLPKGWRMGKLGDLCERITKGTTPTTLKKQFVDKGINFIKVESIDDTGNFIPEKFALIDEETNKLLKRSIVQENDILFTIAGTLGRVAKVDKSIVPANTNQAVSIIRVENPIFVNFIYYLLKSEKFKETIINKAVHAVQANISLGVLSNLDLLIPNDNIIKRFEELIVSISNKLLSNVYQIRGLTEFRDNLLPRLMTGKIQVKT